MTESLITLKDLEELSDQLRNLFNRTPKSCCSMQAVEARSSLQH